MMLSCRGHLYVPGNKYINTIREAAESIVNICLAKGGDCLFKRPANGKKATTIPLKKAVVFEKDINRKPDMIGVSKVSLKSSTKNAKIKTASVFGVDIKPERIESVKDDITLDRLFEIQGEKIDKRS